MNSSGVTKSNNKSMIEDKKAINDSNYARPSVIKDKDPKSLTYTQNMDVLERSPERIIRETKESVSELESSKTVRI